MARTKQAQLDAVDAAIAAIEAGNQSVQLFGRAWSKPDLGKLYEERRRLEAAVNRAARGGGIRFRKGRPAW